MNDFNQICYNFQKNIINTFNQQQNVPFLLKYYLLKDIWENIEKYKTELDIKNQREQQLKQQQQQQNKQVKLQRWQEQPQKQKDNQTE